jgi:D-aminopeptidase
MMILATDAPLSDRNLERLALRSIGGLARTGAALSHGSGDYAIAFSTHPSLRRRPGEGGLRSSRELPNELLSPLFAAAIEATEAAILDALCAAETLCGVDGRCVEALPLAAFEPLLAAGHR